MPTSFLDLGDDVLRRIAHFANRDCYTPFPSFKPFWANFASEITSSNQHDFLAFRSTCKKLYDILDLKGLQIRLNSSDAICQWQNNCPEKVMKGVRRLRLFSEPTKGTSPSTSWSTLTTLLGFLTSLEELIIADFPLYDESRYNPSSETFRAPPFPILLQLKSLSINTKDAHSSTIASYSLLPLAPQIKHIRLFLPDINEPAVQLQKLSELWCKRHYQPNIPIETLILGRGQDTTFIQNRAKCIIQSVKILFPTVRHFTVNSFLGLDYSMSWGIIISRKRKESVKSGMPPEDEEQVGKTFASLLSTLTPFTHLQHLDWGFGVTFNSRRPLLLGPHVDQKEESFTPGLLKNNKRDLDLYLERYTALLKSLAQDLLDHIPTLEGGLFWERSSTGWYKWSWYTEIDDTGEVSPVIDEVPLLLSEDFVTLRLGQNIG